MNREVSFQLSNHSKVLETLKSKYPRFHEPPPIDAAATPDDNMYLTSLWVFEDQEMDEPDSPLPPSFSNLMLDQNIIDPHVIKEKIASALKVVKFRKQHVLVQFWSPIALKTRWLLTTWDQPFGLGTVDEKLCMYRIKSEMCAFVVDKDHKEKLGLPARVYIQKMPEWKLDVHSQDTCYSNHGYIYLPVFESSGNDCVGVLEIITSSSYVDFAFEVHEVWRALKNQNLKSPNVFEDPSISVSDAPSNLTSLQITHESWQHKLDQIHEVLKTVCDTHNLVLAQTWAPSAYNSYVANSENLEQSCSSFNISCIGKACMSTAGLPFYVRDLSKWGFYEACRERHLDKSQGIVGRSLSSCGIWFCKDVTEFDENDYPLVHIARMSGLSSCLTIYLNNLEADVELVVELFLPAHSTNETCLRRLLETVNQQIKDSCWIQLDITSAPHVIGDVPLNWNFESPPSPVDLLTEKGEVSPTESENMETEPSNSAARETSQSVVPYLENGIEDVVINPIKSRRKRKRQERSITLTEISKHFGKTMDEAAASLKVSRSTLKRICRDFGIPRWPYKNGPDKSDSKALMKSNQTDVIAHKYEGSVLTTPASVFGASNESFGGTTHDPTENGKHSSANDVQDHQEQADMLVEEKLSKTVENVTIKVKYDENMVKFTYRLSDGLTKLRKLIATRFQLEIGSFILKYLDEDDDKILIACENDLIMGALGVFRHPESKNVIKLFVKSVFQPIPS
ncbi:hypothetical protein R6Q59_004224 [Mikania micrantha]|uniref:PB1 domain-containing protein n=1 Tax=Mikania micrantha TaxID=192012 RepID=A0A5N6LJR6_9ASTR|nr:hypothetical protein E3N88_42050 [Mikania micrantha]